MHCYQGTHISAIVEWSSAIIFHSWQSLPKYFWLHKSFVLEFDLSPLDLHETYQEEPKSTLPDKEQEYYSASTSSHTSSSWLQTLFDSNTPSCAPTWTVLSELASALLLSPPAGVPTCLAVSLLSFSVSVSEPCLPPELLSSFLISSDLRGGREWGEARLYSNPLWITAACGYQGWATKTPTADPVQGLGDGENTFVILICWLKWPPYLIKDNITKCQSFKYHTQQQINKIWCKILYWFKMLRLSDCLKASYWKYTVFLKVVYNDNWSAKNCTLCSNPSSSLPAQIPADPARSVQGTHSKRQRLLAYLGFKGHEDLSVLQSGWFDGKTQIFLKREKKSSPPISCAVILTRKGTTNISFSMWSWDMVQFNCTHD